MIKRRDKNQVSEAVPYITAQNWALGSQIADKKQKKPPTKQKNKTKTNNQKNIISCRLRLLEILHTENPRRSKVA